MNTSSPQAPKPPSPLHILLLGPPGSGKTTLVMQFPDVLIEDCDENLDGPERLLRKRNPQLTYMYDTIRKDENGEPVPVEEAFNRLCDKIVEAGKEPKVKAIGVDGLTHVNEFIIRNVLGLQRKPKNPYEMEMRDWIPFKSKAYQLFVGKLQGTGKTTICCCHEKILTEIDVKDQMKERIVGYQPAFQGGIVDYFGGFFTDMWRCEARRGIGDSIEYWLQTRKTTKSDLKCSIPEMPSELNLTKSADAFFAILKGKL